MTLKEKIVKKTVEYVFSAQVQISAIFIITIVLLSALLSSRYYFVQNIMDNGISKRNIYAPKTIQVVDTEKTERRKRELAEKIQPILTPAQDKINDDIKKEFEDNVNSILHIRKSGMSADNQLQEIKDIFEFIDQPFQSDAAIRFLLKSSDSQFSRTFTNAQKTLDKILDRGISEEEVNKNSLNIIKQNISGSLSNTQRETIILLVRKVLRHNLVIDDIATEIARKNTMDTVRAVIVTFNKGDKIVSEGDYVTKLQKSALKKLGYNFSQLDFMGIFGIFLLVAICIKTLSYYIAKFEQQYWQPSYLALIGLLFLSIVSFAVFLPLSIPVYIIPIPAVIILLTIFTNSRISLLAGTLILIMIGISLQYKVEAMSVFLLGAVIAAFTSSTVNYYKRLDMVKAGFDVGLVQIVVILSIYLIQSGIEDLKIAAAFTDASLGFVSGLMSGIIALGTLPLIESTFKIITSYGLAELADHNQVLLKRLQFEAPGTYHHSLMVSNLAEAAAETIGLNPVLVRVGAFYHDIGKLKRPLFFVENQSYFGIENPHEKLNPRLSKMVVTAHPKDGLELAKEYKLPNIIKQFIIQHHGNGVAAYFYQQAVEEEGAENITKEQFRYSCPRPTSKEAAILMLADAVESAVRSLKNPTASEIEEIIDKIIRERLFDGQLSETPLTQKDLKNIALAFNRVLRGMQHHRIKYHENVLEELGQKNNGNLKLYQSILEKEQELAAKKETAKIQTDSQPAVKEENGQA